MATPIGRLPIRPGRGRYTDLQASLADLAEGELVYAEDQHELYAVEVHGGVKSLVQTAASSRIEVLLGAYDADGSQISSLTPAATSGGRSGFIVGGKIAGGSGMKMGDYFIVTSSGIPVDDVPSIAVPMQANDRLLSLVSDWVVIASGTTVTASVHGSTDVDDAVVQTVSAANSKGLLLRDQSVADGMPGAYKLVNRLDFGTY